MSRPPKHDLEEAMYQYISGYIKENFYPPSVKEVALHFRIGKTTAYHHLMAMQSRGWLTWRKHFPRTMRVIRQ